MLQAFMIAVIALVGRGESYLEEFRCLLARRPIHVVTLLL